MRKIIAGLMPEHYPLSISSFSQQSHVDKLVKIAAFDRSRFSRAEGDIDSATFALGCHGQIGGS